jgi:histidine ammonia-lyase
MGGYAVRKSAQILENIAYVLGIELMCVLQALDLLGRRVEGRLVRVYEEARKKIKFMEKDR